MSAIQQIAMALAVAGIGAGQGLAQEGAGAARRAAARMEEQAQASMLLLGQARQQYSEGKYQEALDNYRRSLTALPKSPNMEKRRFPGNQHRGCQRGRGPGIYQGGALR